MQADIRYYYYIRFTRVRTEVQDLYNFASIQILDDDSEFSCSSLIVIHPLNLCLACVQGLEWVWRGHSIVSQRVWVWWSCVLLYTSPTSPVPLSFRSISASQLLMELQVCHVPITCTGLVVYYVHAYETNASKEKKLSTGSGADYGRVDVILQFPECVAQQCAMVNVVNDSVDEPEEFFNFTLAQTPGLDPRIKLEPTEGQVVIKDENKGKSRKVYAYSGTSLFQSPISLHPHS